MKYDEIKDYNFEISSINGRAAMGIRRRNLLPDRLNSFKNEEEGTEYSNQFKAELGKNQKRKEFTKKFVGYMKKKEDARKPKIRSLPKKEANKTLFYPATFQNGEGNPMEIDSQMSEQMQNQTDYFSIIASHYQMMEKNIISVPDELRRGQIIQFFLENPNLLKLHDFTPDNFILSVNELDSRSPHSLNHKEFARLINQPRERVHPDLVNHFFERNPLDTSQAPLKYYCLLNINHEADFVKLLEHYKNEHYRGSNVSNLSRFITMIHQEQENFDLLTTYAIYILPLNRLMTVSQVLIEYDIWLRLTEQMDYASDEEPKDFMKFLKIFWDFRMRPEVGFEKYLGTRGDFDDRLEIDEVFRLNIARIWKIMGSPMVAQLSQVIELIQSDGYFSDKFERVVRCESRKKKKLEKNIDILVYRPELETETLEELLIRIEEQADQWVDYNELLQYFTKRGRPM